MIIGTIRERKVGEGRVGLSPAGASALSRSHTVLVESGAGFSSGFSDNEYRSAGACIVGSAEDVVSGVDILAKVKEPLPSEYELLRLFRGKTLFTFLHLSGVERALTETLLEHRITAIAYETVERPDGTLPILAPMSAIAGICAVQNGAHYLQKKFGGLGMTLGYIADVDLAQVVVVGGGVVGEHAARTAAGMGASVTVFEARDARIGELTRMLEESFPNSAPRLAVLSPEEPAYSTHIERADLLVGAVLSRGARAPTVVSERHVRKMKEGAVIVDVSIDQGGCVWGSRPTTHESPCYKRDGKVYSCVTNIPGQVPHQATLALTNAVLPYLMLLADNGISELLQSDQGFLKGLATYRGSITAFSVARDHDMVDSYKDPMLLCAEERAANGGA